MKRHASVIGSHTGLWTMVLGAGVLAAADVSGDGCVTSPDALMILQAAAGRIEL